MHSTFSLLCILHVILLVIFPATVRCGTCEGECQTINYNKLAKSDVSAQTRNSKGIGNSDIEYVTANQGYGKGKWSGLDHCPPNMWVHTVDAASWYDASTTRSTRYLSHLALGCGSISKPKELLVIQTQPDSGERQTEWKFCHEQSGAPSNSLLIGLYFETSKRIAIFKRRAATRVNYLCGHQSPVWIPNALGNGAWREVVCKPGRAICAIEGQFETYGGDNLLFDVRIGCCLVPNQFRQHSVPPFDSWKRQVSQKYLDDYNDNDDEAIETDYAGGEN